MPFLCDNLGTGSNCAYEGLGAGEQGGEGEVGC